MPGSYLFRSTWWQIAGNDCSGCALLAKVIEASPVVVLYGASVRDFGVCISSRTEERSSPCAVAVEIYLRGHTFTSIITPMEGQMLVVMWWSLSQLIFKCRS